jgi:hypothetical protein
MRRRLPVAIVAATLAIGSASPAFADRRSGDNPGAVTTQSCQNGEFTVTVRLPAPPPMGGAQLVVYEAKKPC